MTDNEQDTNDARQFERKVSFTDISLESLQFSEKHRLTFGTSSQLVKGFEYMGNKADAGDDEYKKVLYPALKELCNELVTEYKKLLVTSNDVERSVVGANLNGLGNDGKLRYRISVGGVNRNDTYQYAVFGRLLKLLEQRLKFVESRDATKIQRYVDNEAERTAFTALQENVRTFLKYLETVSGKWTETVAKAREAGGVKKEVKEFVREVKEEREERRAPYVARGRGRGRGRGGFRGRGRGAHN